MDTIFRLQVRQMLGEKKIWILSMFIALPVGLSVVIRAAGGYRNDGSEPVVYGTTVGLYMLYTQVMCELLAMLYATTILSSELEGQTLTYLFTRPVGKVRVIVGKYLAIVAVLVPPVLTSLTLSWLVLGTPGGVSQYFALVIGTVASLFAYNAIFVLLGILIPARAMVVGLIYAMFEFGLSFVPALLNYVTVTYYLRSIVARIMNLKIPPDVRRVIGDESLFISALALFAMCVASLTLSCLSASQKEFVVGKVA